MNSRSPATKSIINPTVDAICVGGLSVVISAAVIGYAWITQAGANKLLLAVQLYLFTDLLINWPHFMASYRLLYGSRQNFTKHPLVTIGLPILAVLFLGYVFLKCRSSADSGIAPQLPIITALEWVAPILLAWHYTGQAWGMTACFSFLSGFRMTATERRLIRSGFYALFAFHVAWVYDSMGFVQSVLPEQEAGLFVMRSVLATCRAAVFLGFVAGLWGFRQLARREGRSIPLRVWLPWLATFCWYAMVDMHPTAFFLLQFFHALQYLTFPVRVELNEFTRPQHKWLHLMIYYGLLVLFGLLAFDGSRLFGELGDAYLPVVTAIVIIINVHHYFIDAVIWKIRDPQVRQALFGHLKPANP